MAEIKKISTELQLLDKFLDTSGDAGTSGQVLTSTGTGINWVSGGSLPGGPYLPLTAGSSYPLTGNLYINDSIPKLIFTDTDTSTVASISANSSNLTYTTVTSARDHIFKAGTDTLVTIEGTGNVGIGTTSPLTKLHIAGTTDANIIRIENTSTALSAGDTIGAIQFFNNDITDDSPNVAASIYATAGASGGSGSLRFKTIEPGVEGDPATEAMIITNGGNVGIGTTSPGALLHLVGTTPELRIATAADGETARLGLYEDSAGTHHGGYIQYVGGGDTLRLGIVNSTVSTDVITIKDNFNVGIGITSPGAKLHVDNSAASLALHVSRNGGGAVTNAATIVSGAAVYINGNESGGSDALRIGSMDNSTGDYYIDVSNYAGTASYDLILQPFLGNVGIGTTNPLGKLQVNEYTVASQGNQGVHGEVSVFANNGDESLFLGLRDSAYPNRGWAFNPVAYGVNSSLQIKEHGSTAVRMTIQSGGNVGIGTTSPDSKLDIEDSNPFVTIQGSSASYVNAGVQFISNHASTARGLGNFYYSAHSDVEWFSGLPYDGNDAFVINRNINYTVPSSQSSPAGVGASAGTLLKVDSAGAIQFNNYSGTNKTGTPTYLLGTDASGNVVKTNTVPGSGAGPYLPLAGGTMTGGITMVDNVGILFGSGGDSFIKHTGTDMSIYNDVGNINIVNRADDKDIIFQLDNGSGGTTEYLVLNGGTTDAYFTNPGNVGIGATTPVLKLEVQGTASTPTPFGSAAVNGVVRIASGSTNPILDIGSNSAAPYEMWLQAHVPANTYGTPISLQPLGGNVGIGTTSPGAKLDIDNGAVTDVRIRGNQTSDARIGAYNFYNTAASDVVAAISADRDGANDAAALAFDTQIAGGGMTERMRIDSAGNVGIGTTTPLSLSANTKSLTINSTRDDLTGALFFRANNSTKAQFYCDSSGLVSDTVSGAARWYTGSTERMRITSAGNVGIGVTNPLNKLHVANGNIRVQGPSNVSEIKLQTDATESYNPFGIIRALRDTNTGAADFGSSELNFLTNVSSATTPTVRMVIDSDGNVGIGTTNPSQKLHVHSTSGDGMIRVSGDNILNSGGEIKGFNNGFAFNVAPSGGGTYVERMRINGSGNVGIATTSPGYKLDVNDTARVRGELRIGANINAYQGDASIWVPNVGQAFTVKANTGNVGIGTTGPSAKLHIDVVTEDNQPAFKITKVSDSGENAMEVYHGTSSALRGIADFTNALGTVMFLRGDGNVGIGTTSPGSKLQVAGEIRAADGNKGAPSYTFTNDTDTGMYSDTADQLDFATGGNIGMVIDSSSNVGIGTTGPTSKLHVQGTSFFFDQAIFDDKIGIGTTSPGNKLEVTGIIEATVGDTGGFAYGANPATKQGLMISVSNTGGDGFSGAGRIENTSTANSSSAVLVLRQTNSASFSTITQYRQGSGTQGNLVGFVRVTTTNTVFSTSGSDERLKKNITNWTDDTLGKFKALQPKKFRYKIQDASEEKTSGFIAQNEVANFPEAYVLNKENEEDDAMYSFNPMGMTTHLMKAIKDLVEKVEILENKITQLENNN